MSTNQFMHPRNIYKTPPDFCKLAETYSEFKNISIKDDKGKVHIDFKDPLSLRILTKCLLHCDFGLNVHIPEDRLVPTLPLRLNYILWIEDLLNVLDINGDVTGIDIGTGACAIYPLLGAVKNKWCMLGTESDTVSYQVAQDNVNNNNLQLLVTLKLNTTKSLLQFLFTEDEELKYDFCMCNPPFYSSFQELYESRSAARPPPKNAFTGSPQELITEGGEIEFINKLIDESVLLKDNIKVFTTMIGHKASLKDLSTALRGRGIRHAHTEFCQGRTTRWGLAWTFIDNCDLKLAGTPRPDNRKKSMSMAFVMQPLSGMAYDSDPICTKVKEILAKLDITNRFIKKKGSRISLELKAFMDTWSNQRRKRRQMKRLEMEQSKKQKASKDDSDKVNVDNNNVCQNNITSSLDFKESLNNNTETVILEQKSIAGTSKDCVDSADMGQPLLHAILSIGKVEKDIVLDLEFLSGTAGKDGMHQVVQYIKNNWK